MHRSMRWTIVTLMGLAGLSSMGSGELGAQTVQSVTFKSPAAGSLVGIDSTFHVDVKVQDFDQNQGLQIAVFLVALGKDSNGKVTDTLLVESGYQNDVQDTALVAEEQFGGVDSEVFIANGVGKADGYLSEIGARLSWGNIVPHSGGTSVVEVSGSGKSTVYTRGTGFGNNPFAAYRIANRDGYAPGGNTNRDRNDNKTTLDDQGDPTSDQFQRDWWGDADSLFITGTDVNDDKIAAGEHKNKLFEETFLIRWYSTVNEIMGEHDEIYAAAFVRDPGDPNATPAVPPTWSDIVISDNSIKIDGDRPIQGKEPGFRETI